MSRIPAAMPDYEHAAENALGKREKITAVKLGEPDPAIATAPDPPGSLCFVRP